MANSSVIEKHPVLVVGGLVVSAFIAGWAAQSAVIAASNQIVIPKIEYVQLIKIKNGRTVSDEDKQHINKIISLFNQKAFTNDLMESENFKLMFKQFNNVRIDIQKTRPKINNLVYANLIATAEKDMDYLVSLSPWTQEELSSFDSSSVMEWNVDNQRLEEWSKSEGSAAFSEMRSNSKNDEPLYFNELFDFVRKKQERVIGLILTIERMHKNNIVDGA